MIFNGFGFTMVQGETENPSLPVNLKPIHLNLVNQRKTVTLLTDTLTS